MSHPLVNMNIPRIHMTSTWPKSSRSDERGWKRPRSGVVVEGAAGGSKFRRRVGFVAVNSGFNGDL